MVAGVTSDPDVEGDSSSLVSSNFLSSQVLHFTRSFRSLEGDFLLLGFDGGGGGLVDLKVAGLEDLFDEKV